MHRHVLRFILVAGAIVAAACVYDAPVSPADNTPSMQRTAARSPAKAYVIDFTGNTLPANLAAQVAKAGGVLTTSIDQIGVAVATSEDPKFADRAVKIRGVFSVQPDPTVQWVQPERVVEAGEVDVAEAGTVEPTAIFGTGETFRRAQWVPDAMSAPDAWDLGARGAGARVAVLDGGIRDTHIDIAPNLDVARSRSFVPDTIPNTFLPFNFEQRADSLGCRLNDTFWHGTHVAGIIAAPGGPGNANTGIVGIAPSATIIGVKVLHCGSGDFSWILNGIVYAATPIAEGGAGADIINMSLGADFEHQARDSAGKAIRDTITGKVIHTARGAAQLARAIGKATRYAHQRGVTVIAALGNTATDLDKTNDLMSLPAMSPHVIAVSATGPLGFVLGATNFDRPASYTNFGQSAVDFAAGGGDFVLPGEDFCALPRNPSGLIITRCWVFDMVMAPCRGSGATNGAYCWAAGTSMASPAVAGVAALIIGKYGRIGPAAVEARLRASADDLGKPGNDDFYGRGRVNALRAIQ
jgi:lantibiotic leader peptide-processing serine protease